MVITLTGRGYIKRMPLSTYKNQHRGGKGIIGMSTRESDVLQHLLVSDTHDNLLFFTTAGKVYSLRCFELPEDATRTTRGTSIINLLSMAEGERVNAIVRTEKGNQDGYILLATRKGEIKRMNFSSLANIRSNGLIAMDLEPGDELVSAWKAHELDEIVMVTQGGMAARFPVTNVRVTSRYAGGVRGIRLEEGDTVISMDVVLQGAQLLVLSQNGFGKLTPMGAYRRTARGAKGVRTLRITDKTGPVVAAHPVVGANELMIVSRKGIIIRMPISDIPVKGRYTQGVWMMRPGSNDAVATVTSMNDDDV